MSGDSFKIMRNDKLVDITELKVTELKEELKKRGVSTTGNKQELFEKLRNVRIIICNLIIVFVIWFWTLIGIYE